MPRNADDVRVRIDYFEWPPECDEFLQRELQGCEFACGMFSDKSRNIKEVTLTPTQLPL